MALANLSFNRVKAVLFTGLSVIDRVNCGIGVELVESNETYLRIESEIFGQNWQLAQLYMPYVMCQDANGNNLSEVDCKVTSPETYAPQPAVTIFSELVPGSTYILHALIRYRRSASETTGFNSNYFTRRYCTCK